MPTSSQIKKIQQGLQDAILKGPENAAEKVRLQRNVKAENNVVGLLVQHFSRSNIAQVKYAEGGKPLHSPLWDHRLNEISCDNFVLHAIQPSYNFGHDGKCDNTGGINEIIRGRIHTAMRIKIGKSCGAITTKRIDMNEYKHEIQAYKVARPQERQKWLNEELWYRLEYKIGIPDVHINDKFLGRFKYLFDLLAKDAVFFSDIDMKVDLGACLKSREEIEGHLREVESEKVQLQVDCKRGKIAQDMRKLYLLDNAKKVGKNCHTFLCYNEDGELNMRLKLYNKFAQTLESPAVRRAAGCHVFDWCVDSKARGEQLGNAIKSCLELGLTRAEITWYRTCTTWCDPIPRMNEITNELHSLCNMFDPLVVHTPIDMQWRNFACKLNNTIVVINSNTGTWEIVRWYSSYTGKRNAFVSKPNHTNAHTLLQCIAHCTIGALPIKVIFYGATEDLKPVGLSTDAPEFGDDAVMEGYMCEDEMNARAAATFEHDDCFFYSAVDAQLHGQDGTTFVHYNGIYGRKVDVNPADFGLVEAPTGVEGATIKPVLLPKQIRSNELCAPSMTWSTTTHGFKTRSDGSKIMPLSDTLEDQIAKRNAMQIEAAPEGSIIHLTEVGVFKFRGNDVWYGLTRAGKLYKLPTGPAYANGCDVYVGLFNRISVNGEWVLNWKARAKPLLDRANGTFNVLAEQQVGTKRKICVEDDEQLYIAEECMELNKTKRYRKHGKYLDERRYSRARIIPVHNDENDEDCNVSA